MESFLVSFEVKTLLGYSYQGIVQPNSTASVTIPRSYELSTPNDRISITTYDDTIRVHGLNYYSLTTDGYLALPCTPLGIDSYEYYALTYHDNSFYLERSL